MLYFFARARIAGRCNSRACAFCLRFVLELRRDDFYPDLLERDDQNDDDEQKEEEESHRSCLPP